MGRNANLPKFTLVWIKSVFFEGTRVELLGLHFLQAASPFSSNGAPDSSSRSSKAPGKVQGPEEPGGKLISLLSFPLNSGLVWWLGLWGSCYL